MNAPSKAFLAFIALVATGVPLTAAIGYKSTVEKEIDTFIMDRSHKLGAGVTRAVATAPLFALFSSYYQVPVSLSFKNGNRMMIIVNVVGTCPYNCSMQVDMASAFALVFRSDQRQPPTDPR
jgi:hypothetical protein